MRSSGLFAQVESMQLRISYVRFQLSALLKERNMVDTVFVIDDHTLVRNAIVQIINMEEDLQVVGEGDGSAETIEAVRKLRPRVLVVDLEMPRMRGADLIALAKDMTPPPGVLVCTMHASHGYVSEALRRGADGYVLKSSPSAQLIDGIRRVAAGLGWIDPTLQTDVIKLLQKGDSQRVSKEMTAQEIEVLRFAAEGLTNQEIAERTRQSVETVKLRLRRSFQKLGATDRANAVALAVRQGLI
jgi:DNA-binding NarL/FixJ family response regulator